VPHSHPMMSKLDRAHQGYLLAVLAAILFCGNGAMSRLLLDDGMPAVRLSGLRVLITFVALLAWLAATDRHGLSARKKDLPRLVGFGIGGLALVNLGYFIAIERLGVGVGLTLEYMGPILLLVWLRVRYRRDVPPRVWAAAALALLGCFLVVEGWKLGSLDLFGLAGGLSAAVGFAVYAWGAERSGHSYRPGTTLLYFSGAATIFWLIATPPWTYSWTALSSPANIGAAAYVGLVGTLGGFACAFAAVQRIPAARASVVMTLEPALAALIAWPALGEVLSPTQIIGGAVVLTAVMWIQGQRQAGPEEQAPPFPASKKIVDEANDQQVG